MTKITIQTTPANAKRMLGSLKGKKSKNGVAKTTKIGQPKKKKVSALKSAGSKKKATGKKK